MTGALAYYLIVSMKNRALSRWKRLRQPKYLVSALAGLGYLVLVFQRQVFNPARAGATPASVVEVLPAVETMLAILLLLAVLVPWLWPGKGRGIRFSEAEIQFLFPAPLSRRSLVRYRLATWQPGILFGVVVTALIFGRSGWFAHTFFFMAGLWMVYSFLSVYRTGVSLVKTSLAEHGAVALRRHARLPVLAAAAAIALLVWAGRFLADAPAGSAPGTIDRLLETAASGPARYFLLPFRLMVHPAFARDWPEFMLSLAAPLVLLFLVYLWVARSDAAFEEAALERARREAARLQGAGADRVRLRRGARRTPFALRAEGPAFTAVFWKNLIAAGRLSARRMVLVLVLVAVAAAGAGKLGEGGALPAALGGTAAGVTVFLVLAGPVLVRDDLRSDLLYVDVLKTYPMTGRSVVLGEIMAPAVLLAALEWMLLLAAGLLLTSAGALRLSAGERIAYAAAAALVLPCLTAVGLIAQNALALLMPGWIQLGKHHGRGIEAMGQRLITMAGTVVILVFAALPAGILFLAIFLAGYRFIGAAAAPVAALAAALVLLGESALAVAGLGRLFDRFDASAELDHF